MGITVTGKLDKKGDSVTYTYASKFGSNVGVFVAPCAGLYRLDVYGAQGGCIDIKDLGFKPNALHIKVTRNVAIDGGLGGESGGFVYLLPHDVLYIHPGEQPEKLTGTGGNCDDYYIDTLVSSHNGGGAGSYSTSGWDESRHALYCAGGGASFVSIGKKFESGLPDTKEDVFNHVLLLSGGGGGAGIKAIDAIGLGEVSYKNIGYANAGVVVYYIDDAHGNDRDSYKRFDGFFNFENYITYTKYSKTSDKSRGGGFYSKPSITSDNDYYEQLHQVIGNGGGGYVCNRARELGLDAPVLTTSYKNTDYGFSLFEYASDARHNKGQGRVTITLSQVDVDAFVGEKLVAEAFIGYNRINEFKMGR